MSKPEYEFFPVTKVDFTVCPGADSTPMGVQRHETLGATFGAGMYACRPPGMPHGPWRTDEGVVTFEVRYPA